MNQSLIIALQKRKSFLEKLIKAKRSALTKAPEGRLRLSRSGNRVQYYCRTDPTDTNGKYIRTSDRQLAAGLAQKDYDRRVLTLAENELKAVTHLLKQYDAGQAETVYEQLQKSRQDLIHPIRLPDAQFAESWQAVVYEKKNISEDIPEYLTAKGEQVRSKSEILIADALNRAGVPYRYEAPLRLKKAGLIYPDFTVLNIQTRREYYWEHLGMMDNPDYAESALDRISCYEYDGFYPGDKLILTFESKSNPIKTRLIEDLIRYYLL